MPIFAWLSADPSRYMAVSETALLAFTAIVIAGSVSRRVAAFLASGTGTAVVLASALLALTASRWPTFFLEANPLDNDTAEFIAQALTALRHPIPWHDFDGLTSGPYNTYAVMLPALLGIPLSFESTDVLTLLLDFTAVVATYGTLCLCFDANVARLGIFAPVIFWSATVRDEFVYYSSEIFPTVLAALSIWLLAFAWRRGFPSAALFASGVLAGMVPLAKLQSAPMAAALGVGGLGLVAIAGDRPRRERLVRIAAFAAGLASVPALTLAWVAASGSFNDFWTSYILSSIGYLLPDYMPPSYLMAGFDIGPHFDWLLAVTVFGAVVAAVRFQRLRPATRVVFALAVAYLAINVYCMYAPRRGSTGYLLYAIVPAAAAAGAALGVLLQSFARMRLLTAIAGAAFVAVTLVVDQGFPRRPNPWLPFAYAHWAAGGDADGIAADIVKDLPAGSRLAIWGYRPKYFVFTRMLLGTRDATAINQFMPYPNPYQSYFRKRYISDMTENRPEGFLDAGSDSWASPQNAHAVDYETWPELAAIVNRDYVLADRWQDFRLFVRRDLRVSK